MFSGAFGIWHWLIVLAIVVVVFGTKKLGNVGKDLGNAVRGFKDGVKGEGADAPKTSAEESGRVIEVADKDKR